MVMDVDPIFGLPAPAAGTPATDYDTEFAAAMVAGAAAIGHPTENTFAGNHTITGADDQRIVRITAAGTVTIPSNAADPLPVGFACLVYADTAGTVAVTGDGGAVVVKSRGSVFNLAGQDAEAMLRKRATDTWVLSGDLA